MDKKNKRNGFLDFLKFIFAIIIVIGHGDTVYGVLLPDRIIPLASFAVEFFFIASGAMLLRSIEKQSKDKSKNTIGTDTFNFMKHKIKGLLPNYYVAWVVLFIMMSIGDSFKNIIFSFFKAIPELLLIRMSGMPTQSFNGNTWYISAMLLALLIIYPLIRKNKDFFIKYIAPVTVIFGIGFITHNYRSVLVIEEWTGFVYYGLIRGIVDICIGCIAYELSKKLKDINFTKFGKIMLTFVEVFSYIGVILLLFSYGFRYYCFVLLFVLMISVSITLSDTSYSKNIFSFNIFNWLGKYSYSLYLGHGIAYSAFIGDYIFSTKFSYSETMIIYFIVSLISGLFIMYLSKLVSYVLGKCKPKIKNLLIVNE